FNSSIKNEFRTGYPVSCSKLGRNYSKSCGKTPAVHESSFAVPSPPLWGNLDAKTRHNCKQMGHHAINRGIKYSPRGRCRLSGSREKTKFNLAERYSLNHEFFS